MTIKVLELFAGIGACSKALTNLGIEHEIVDAVEIDKYAIKSFNAIHSTNFEPQDITKWDKDIECDLIMHGSPCQDFSVAGRQAGGDKDSGTRSSLMYETLRIVEKLKPKYVIWENVKNLLSQKHKHNFDSYLEAMDKLGYKSYYQVLNAKDYGIPQNRERVFTISIRKGADSRTFSFPEPITLEKRLKDVLEDNVEEKFYLSNEKIDRISKWKCYEKPLEHIMNKDSICGTLTTRSGAECGGMKTVIDDIYSNREPRVYNEYSPTLRSERFGLKVKEPMIVASRGRYEENPNVLRKVRTEYGKSIRKEYEEGKIKAHRSAIQKLEPRNDGITNTITTVQKDNYVATPYRIRKLTPKECYRLMGFDDSDFAKAEKVNSNAQLYKQAGNSIVVNVLEAILSNLLKGKNA